MSDSSGPISPRELADALDEVRIRMSSLQDGYARLFELHDFLSQHLRRVQPSIQATPYLLELQDELLAATAFQCAPEANPIRLRAVLLEVRHWGSLAPTEVASGWEKAATRIEQEILVVSALLGDFDPVSEFFGTPMDDMRPSGDPKANADLLNKLVIVSKPGWMDAVNRRLAAARDRETTGTTARFPSVFLWSERDAGTHRSSRGILCSLSFSISTTIKGEDDLSMGPSSLHDQSTSGLMGDISTAGRRMLRELAPEALAQGYRGVFEMEIDQARLEGQSMRSLMAVLYVLEVIRFTDRRTSYHLHAETVISGDLDHRGRILPVDDASIPRKVEAAFFSTSQQIIVPRRHVSKARDTVEKLQESYPLRQLSILSADSIFDIFADRRVIRKRVKGRARYAVEQTWKNRSQILSTAAVLLITTAIVLLSSTRIDPHIVGYGLEDGGQLNFLNADGETVYRFAVGARTYRDMSGKGARYIEIGDVNGDGYNEAFWSTQTNFESSKFGTVVGIDGASGDTLLHFIPDFKLRYPNDISIQSHDMVPHDLTLLDTNNDGRLELLVAFEHVEYYPSILASINPLTGDVLQRYDHPGALRELMTADINANGREEILVAGINNSMRMPIFAVLDPTDFSDTGPATRNSYRSLPERIGKELAYFTFPKSPIANIDGRLADWINVLPDGQVTINVWDSYHEVDGIRTPTSYRVTFDEQLRPVSLGTSNDWDAVYEQAAQEGRVPPDFSNDMKLEMLTNVRRIK